MKKLFTLALSLILGVSAFAQVDQTFVFTDAAGNVIPDGTTLTVNNYEESAFGDMQFGSGLFVKNNSASNAYASMTINISKIDNGQLQHCFPGTCQMYEVPGETVRADAAGIKAGATQSINSEWLPLDKGNCSVTYTIRLMELVKPMPPTYGEKAVCSTVTVNYVYDEHSHDITAIDDITVEKKTSTAKYNLNGQKVGSDYRGVVILNGKKTIAK